MVRLLIAFVLALCADVAQAQSTCAPAVLGHPCSPGGVASQGHVEPAINLGMGNPVNLATGNKHQYDIDLPRPWGKAGLGLARHYNSMSPRTTSLGPGWTTDYDTRLYQVPGGVVVLQADGGRIHFAGTPPFSGPKGQLRKQGKLWYWLWPTGHLLAFDEQGLLVRVRGAHPRSPSLSIQRHQEEDALQGHIAEIVMQAADTSTAEVAADGPQDGTKPALTPTLTPAPDRLRFQYDIIDGRAYLVTLDTRAGKFTYQYDDGSAQPYSAPRLRAVTRPDGMTRQYLYEPEHQGGNARALTGVVIVSADGKTQDRINTWRYDRWGRVVSVSSKGEARSSDVKIEYQAHGSPKSKGLTTVTTAQGHLTHYEFALTAGRYVVTSVKGAGCPACLPTGLRAQYDAGGRLLSINGLSLNYLPEGRLGALASPRGWPGLRLFFNASGQRHAWQSELTGQEDIRFDQRGRPALRHFANGDQWRFHYDDLHRPIKVEQSQAGGHPPTRISLTWQGARLHTVQHPNETETLQYDRHGRLILRAVQRQVNRQAEPWRYTEGFDYDDHGRLISHRLPEGGTLLYRWGAGAQLLDIVWQTQSGELHTVIHSQPAAHGYRYGNGLHMTGLNVRGQAASLQVSGPGGPIWQQFLDYDNQRQMRVEQHAIPPLASRYQDRYAYDSLQRLVGVARQHMPVEADAHIEARNVQHPSSRWLAWRADGSLAAQRPAAQSEANAAVRRDPSGLPTRVGPYSLKYNASRRLVQVNRNGHSVARYLHNAYGYRISKMANGVQTQYLYHGNRLVAEAVGQAGQKPDAKPAPVQAAQPRIYRRYIYAHQVPVGFIDYSRQAPEGRLYFVHSDLLAAPRVVTDQQQRVRWAASYSVTGKASQIAGHIDFQLRLPGQIESAETGWHDNLLRTYDPESGHYLEPDPLGPIPGNQALGYAAQQPRRYVDPLGLMLFAFDGTRNNPVTQSNVWKLGQRYKDGAVFYHSGPGNPYFIDWDAVTARDAGQILDTQWLSLLVELQRHPPTSNNVVPIDILGFSRGAALARHFANQIERHVDQGLFSYQDPRLGAVSACVDLRFIGLFDTVAQFGLGGQENHLYDLSIASSWGWVAHAVALHERRWLFPLNTTADTGAGNVVEAPFIGAHADIGGGVPYLERGESDTWGDLSDVALNWMLWQARAASVEFGGGPVSQRQVTHPILHDERLPLQRSLQEGDRRIDRADGSLKYPYQDHDARLGREAREATETLIRRYEDWRRRDGNAVGEVDMQGYQQWLEDELGWFGAPA